MLLAGLAIDSGLLYLAKARLARAVDGAALAAVGNFSRTGTVSGSESQTQANRDAVAVVMRNFAVANFTALSPIAATVDTPGGTAVSVTGTNGQTTTSYFYNFSDGTQDPNGAYRRFVSVTLNTGTGGAITSATCNARCPVPTYFIGYASSFGNHPGGKIGGYSGVSSMFDLKVSSSAVATRNPRLIMIVIDRSASMLAQGGGATGLPPAIVQFLDFFDTSSDNIGIVSFGTAARLEMPMTTNFIIAGTNNLIDAYNNVTNSSGTIVNGEPGVDPEDGVDPNYPTAGVRRLKFGGSTCADDGIRLAMEQLMANSGFSDPDVVKYMVIFTDGAWNTARTLFAAPGYGNYITCPSFSGQAATTNIFVSNPNASTINGAAGAWSTNLLADTGLLPVPTLSPMPEVTNAIAGNDGALYNEYYASYGIYHTNDVWLSTDGSAYEPLGPKMGMAAVQGGSGFFQGNTTTTTAEDLISTTTYLGQGTNSSGVASNLYTHNLDVWLQPGSVAYYYRAGSGFPTAFVSNYNDPTQHINMYLNSGDSMYLIVPGYIADGTFYDGLDLSYPDNSYTVNTSTYPLYRADNFNQPYMWEDDTVVDPCSYDANSQPFASNSLERQLMFRNYANLLTGFYVSRPSYPLGPGYEPLITEDNPPGAPRALDPLGPYYPSAAFYWPFGGAEDVNSNVIAADGVAFDPTYSLINPLSEPDGPGYAGQARHNAYSINMLSTNAAPQWAGELFYKSSSGNGATAGTGNTAVSKIMTSSDWQVGAPAFMGTYDTVSGLMVSEGTHDTNITPNPSVWRPVTFNGSNFPTSLSAIEGAGPGPTGLSATAGYVSDGQGHYFANAMAWSGRPTHYYDFSKATWVPVANNHAQDVQALTLGNWKAQEYAWHARALGVTIYTVGYGTLVSPGEQAFLAQIANATNTTAGGGSNIAFNASQPIGQQFYATNAAQISNDFYSVGQAINAALTQ